MLTAASGGYRAHPTIAFSPRWENKMNTCYLAETDVSRLERHAAQAGPQSGYPAMLDMRLKRATVVDAADIDPHIVTMNSTVTLPNRSGSRRYRQRTMA